MWNGKLRAIVFKQLIQSVFIWQLIFEMGIISLIKNSIQIKFLESIVTAFYDLHQKIRNLVILEHFQMLNQLTNLKYLIEKSSKLVYKNMYLQFSIFKTSFNDEVFSEIFF